jgi:hypothetical protein
MGKLYAWLGGSAATIECRASGVYLFSHRLEERSGYRVTRAKPRIKRRRLRRSLSRSSKVPAHGRPAPSYLWANSNYFNTIY